MNGLLVHAAGPRTLIQDRGRFGHHRLGVTTGGPLDWVALDWGNAVLGNGSDAAALEVTLGPLELEVMMPTSVAVTGPGRLTINGADRPAWAAQAVAPGDRVRVTVLPCGLCAYLSVAGGVRSAPILGSRATVTREGLGGIHGQDASPLRAGDFVPAERDDVPRTRVVPEACRPTEANTDRDVIVRMLPGFQWRAFPRETRRAMAMQTFTVSPESSRMGVRLDGPRLTDVPAPGASEGVCTGAIQVTPDGQPIVLLADRQTIGGYPKPGAVITADLPRIGQLRPGRRVRLQPVAAATARAALAGTLALFSDCARRWEADTGG